jgi:hypothetical protein
MADPKPRSVESLTKLERNWLKRRECGWCEAQLHSNTCYAMTGSVEINGRTLRFGGACSVEDRDYRRGIALATYKPRKPRG